MKTTILGIFTGCITLCGATSALAAAEGSSAAQVMIRPVFPLRLEWIGPQEPPEAESAELLADIDAFNLGGVRGGLAALETFVSAHPQSAWTPALRASLAEHYRGHGRYSLALPHWELAWEAAKALPDSKGQRVAARVLANWTGLLASLGQKDKIIALFDEAERAHLPLGAYGTAVEGTKEGLATMKTKPGESYRCGSFALGNLGEAMHLDTSVKYRLLAAQSPDGGFSIAQLIAMAQTNGMALQAVRRPAGAEIIVPCVIHWKLNHYAAILERKGEGYRVMDPTFGGHLWMDAETIDAEASGAFLVPSEKVPSTWQRLSDAESASTFGKGFPTVFNNDEPPPNPCCDQEDVSDTDCDPPSANDGAGDGGPVPPPPPNCCCGMIVWDVSEPLTTLWLTDTPLSYRLSSGKTMPLTLHYKHRDPAKSSYVGSFGSKWECNWLGLLEDYGQDTMTNHLAGGGTSPFATNGTPDYRSVRILSYEIATGARVITSPMGSQNRYGFHFPLSGGPTLHLLSERADRYGRKVRFNYQTNGGNVLLSTVVDIDGRTNTLAYGNTSFPTVITAVTNPYGQSALFTYDHLGRLTNIVDSMGMSSSVQYDSSDFVTNMITLYGPTSFQSYVGTNSNSSHNRAMLITEATGDKQLYAYCDVSADPSPCSQSEDVSFHWNRAQYAAITAQGKTNYLDMPGEDYQKAPVKQWLHQTGLSATITDTVGAMAEPFDPGLGVRPRCMQFSYEGTGNPLFIGTMQRVTNINMYGTLVQFTRNSLGRMVSFTNFGGGGVAAGYSNILDGTGRYLQQQLGPRGELVRTYGYHPVIGNLLTSVTDAAGNVTRYTHDTNTMKVTSITFPGGLIRTNIYYSSGPSQGFLQTRIDLGVRTNSFSYTNGNILVQTNELGLVTTNTWDNLNRLVSVAYPDGTTTSNNYDKLDIIGVKDRLNQWTRYGYNAVRQVVAVTNANGQLTQYAYCGCGSPSLITNWNGSTPFVTQFTYDMAGRLTNALYADGYQISRAFDQYSRLQSVTDSGGRSLSFDYAQLGLREMVANTSLSGSPVRQDQFDEYARVTNTFNRNAVTVTNAYDSVGRLVARRTIGYDHQLSGLESFVYDARGLTNSIDPLGHLTIFVHDNAGRVLYQTNAERQALQFTYNPADELLTLSDGKNQTTTWNYDQYGRLTNKLDATSTEIFRYQYDPADRLTNRWSAAKGNTAYRYDAVGNLTNIVYPVSSNVLLGYDGLNRLTSMVDGIGTTAFAWTGGNQLASEDGPWTDDTVTYAYNNRLRSGLSLLQPNGSPWTQSYGYDAYGRLTSTASAAGALGYLYASFGTGNPSDLIQQLNYPSGAFNYRIYDGLAELTNSVLYAADSTVLDHHGYVYDQGFQRTQQVFQAWNYMTYRYDSIGQLTNATGNEYGGAPRLHEQFGYAYDKAWNLSVRTNNALVQTFNVNSLNELTTASRSGTLTVAGGVSSTPTNLTVKDNGNSPVAATVYNDNNFARTNVPLLDGTNTFTAVAKDNYGRSDTNAVTVYLPVTNSFTYDSNGNLISDGNRYFAYDDENQLTSVTVSNAWRSEFAYDGLMRRRIRREFTWSGGGWSNTNEVRYIYDDLLVMQERDASNLPAVTYTRGSDVSGELQDAGGIGGLLARTDNRLMTIGDSSSHAYYHCDGNGNVTCLINSSNVPVARYNYDPFGNSISMNGPLAEANLYRFSSKEQHVNSGLLYYLYRYYDPNLQRWVNRDPIEEDGGINLYQFVLNTPISQLDSLGLDDGKCKRNLEDDNLPPEKPYKEKPAKSPADYEKKAPLEKYPEMVKAQAQDRAGKRSIEGSKQEDKDQLRQAALAREEEVKQQALEAKKKLEALAAQQALEAAQKALAKKRPLSMIPSMLNMIPAGCTDMMTPAVDVLGPSWYW